VFEHFDLRASLSAFVIVDERARVYIFTSAAGAGGCFAYSYRAAGETIQGENSRATLVLDLKTVSITCMFV
jgi:hypothetical protein